MNEATFFLGKADTLTSTTFQHCYLIQLHHMCSIQPLCMHIYLRPVGDKSGNKETNIVVSRAVVELLVQCSHPGRHFIWNCAL